MKNIINTIRSWFKKHYFFGFLLLAYLVLIAILIIGGAISKKSIKTDIAVDNSIKSESKPVITLSLYEKLQKIKTSVTFEDLYNLESLDSCVELFNQYNLNNIDVITVKEGLNSASSTEKQLAEKLKKDFINRDIQHKPRLRKACADIMKKTLWEEDIDISISGTGNTILTLTGSIFASNKGVKAMHEAGGGSEGVYMNLGFKQINYKWYKDASEWTYFKLEPKKDGALFD